MEVLNWKVIFENTDVAGFKTDQNGDVWFANAGHKPVSDYDNRGMNHIAIRTEQLADVETVAEFLKKKGVELLFGTPKHRPEFAAKETETYYQIMFKSPDNLLFEVVFIGPKKS